jgi:hypothetical protein
LDDLIADMHRYGDPLEPSEAGLVAELSEVAEGIRSGTIIPPIGGGENLPPLEKKMLKSDRFKIVFPSTPVKASYSIRNYHLSLPLFHGWCPYVARKPPLPAPVPGLDGSPPDFTMVKKLIDTKTWR